MRLRAGHRTTPWGRGMQSREVLILCGAILLGRAEPSRSDAAGHPSRSSPEPHRCPTSPSKRTKCRQQHGRLDVNLGGPEFLKRHSSEMLDQGLDFPPPSSPLAATLKQVLRVQPGEGDAAQGSETALLQYAPIQPWLAPPSHLLC